VGEARPEAGALSAGVVPCCRRSYTPRRAPRAATPAVRHLLLFALRRYRFLWLFALFSIRAPCWHGRVCSCRSRHTMPSPDSYSRQAASAAVARANERWFCRVIFLCSLPARLNLCFCMNVACSAAQVLRCLRRCALFAAGRQVPKGLRLRQVLPSSTSVLLRIFEERVASIESSFAIAQRRDSSVPPPFPAYSSSLLSTQARCAFLPRLPSAVCSHGAVVLPARPCR